MARLLVALVLINMIICVRQGLCEGGKGLVCDYYNNAMGMENVTETCKSDDEYCYVVWGEEQNERNETLHRVVLKGCFKISPDEGIQYCNQDHCIQNHKYNSFKSVHVSGFCCCDVNMCNTNFTTVLVDYVKYESTVASTTTNAFREGGKCLVCEKTVRGIQNGTESCKNAGDFCFASWEDENARVLSKGCFETYGHGWLHPECQQDACIEADAGEPYGFCCCNTNLCNANFTAVDDEPTIPPITEKHHSNGSTKQKIVVACVVSVALVVFITLVVAYIMYKRKHHRGVIRYVKCTE